MTGKDGADQSRGIPLAVWDTFAILSPQARGVSAGEGSIGEVADIESLVKDGAVAADERPLVGPDQADLILGEAGQADVEHLAVVVDVSVVAVGAAFAAEGQVKRAEEEEVSVHGKVESPLRFAGEQVLGNVACDTG